VLSIHPTLTLVDASHGFLGVPGGADFSVGVTGVEEATEAGSAPVADTFGSGCQEASYPIERVSFAAPVPGGFVLDSASYFVESLVRQPDDGEGVCYL